MAGEEPGRPRNDALWSEMGRYAGLGAQLVAVIALFGSAGWWLDGRLGVTPLFTILGTMGGSAAWFYSLYRHLVIEPRRRAAEARAEEVERGGPWPDQGGSG